MAWNTLPDDWRKDLLVRRQERLVGLYKEHGWLDRAKSEFDEEEMRLSDQYEAGRRALETSDCEAPEDENESLSTSEIYRDGNIESDAAEEADKDEDEDKEEAEPNETEQDGSGSAIRGRMEL